MVGPARKREAVGHLQCELELSQRRTCKVVGHRKVFGFRRLLSKRFPYGIYYEFKNGEVIVYRVLDLRQHPRQIRSALKRH